MKNTNDRTITAINHTVGNSKFCSKAEALDYARTCGNRHGWVALCKRQDVTPEEAIMYVKESNYWILWCDLLRRTDVLEYLNGLSSREAIAFAKKVQEERIWKIVLSREDVSPVLAISLARSIVPCWGRGPISDWRESDPSVWESVLARTDVPLREAVFHATNFTKLNATELWVGITSRQDVTFIEAISMAESFFVKDKANRIGVWRGSLTRSDAPLEEVARYARILNHQLYWGILVQRNDISFVQALAYANESKDSHVEYCVYQRSDAK